MIKVTRLDNRELVINAELIEFLETTPETMVSMTTGKRVVIRESVEEILRRIAEYRRRALPIVKTPVNGS